MESKQEVYPLQGMICRQCEDIVCQRLLLTRGVITAEASYWRGIVIVEYDPEIISSDALIKELGQSGYPVCEKARGGAAVDVIFGILILVLLLLLQAIPLPGIPAVDSSTPFGMIFLCGLATSAHCIAMCGGIMLAQTSRVLAGGDTRRHSFAAALRYHLGRILTCTLLGAIFGAAGMVITYTVKMKSFVFTFAGALVTLLGIQMWGGFPWLRRLSVTLPASCSLPGRILREKSPLLVGLLTGVMPCSASYAMWLIAMSSGSALRGLFTMLAWSLGTVPLMFLFAVFGSFLPKNSSKWMAKINVALIITFGLKMLVNGIRLF